MNEGIAIRVGAERHLQIWSQGSVVCHPPTPLFEHNPRLCSQLVPPCFRGEQAPKLGPGRSSPLKPSGPARHAAAVHALTFHLIEVRISLINLINQGPFNLISSILLSQLAHPFTTPGRASLRIHPHRQNRSWRGSPTPQGASNGCTTSAPVYAKPHA